MEDRRRRSGSLGDIRLGNAVVTVNPALLENRKARGHVPARSSGSAGPATPADVTSISSES